jgi:hypothetical protein
MLERKGDRPRTRIQDGIRDGRLITHGIRTVRRESFYDVLGVADDLAALIQLLACAAAAEPEL